MPSRNRAPVPPHPRLKALSASAARAFSALSLGLALSLPSSVLADEAPPPPAAPVMSEAERDRQAEAISRSIMSPFCPGRTVSACPNAGPWRDDIRKWVGEGVDADEIKRRLAERVPDHNLGGAPKNRLGWVLPVGLAVGAVGILVFLLRYLVGQGTGATAARKDERADEAGPSRPRDVGKSASEGQTSSGGSNDVKGAADASGSGKVDWDARLDRELETLES